MNKLQNLKIISIILSILMLILAAGCNANNSNQNSKEPSSSDGVQIEDQKVPANVKPQLTYMLNPVASGVTVYQNEKVIIDASNSSQGYIMVKYSGSNQKIKIQITKAGAQTYTYNLNARDAYEVFPLSEGNGSYNIKVFENISGTSYTQAASQDIVLTLQNDFLPFLYPNQYVNFTENSQAVQLGATLASQGTTDIEVVGLIYDYVVNNFTYDKVKAQNVQSGYLPNVDLVLQEKKGICFDYAAVMAAMLRTQNIPTKLVVGYTGDIYHAWINVYTDEMGWIDNAIYFDGENWHLLDPTFASSGKGNEAILNYIKDSSNYQAQYLY